MARISQQQQLTSGKRKDLSESSQGKRMHKHVEEEIRKQWIPWICPRIHE